MFLSKCHKNVSYIYIFTAPYMYVEGHFHKGKFRDQELLILGNNHELSSFNAGPYAEGFGRFGRTALLKKVHNLHSTIYTVN